MPGANVADVTVRPVAFGETGRFNAELDARHWLGHRLTGQVLRYVAELDGQWVAVAGFGSARCRAPRGMRSSAGAGSSSTPG